MFKPSVSVSTVTSDRIVRITVDDVTAVRRSLGKIPVEMIGLYCRQGQQTVKLLSKRTKKKFRRYKASGNEN